MSIILRLIAVSLAAGSACAVPTSSAGISVAATGGEGPVDARTTNAASLVGDSTRNVESEIDVVSKLFLGSIDRRHVRLANAAYPWLTAGNVYFVYEWNRVLVIAAAGD